MSSTSNKEYCVNWKNHMSHVRQAFDSLLCSNELTDVMIYCEGKKVSAHRMVLSACSAYFREIFKNNPYQNPIIVIPGVEYAVLTDIIRFIYQGEVSVDTAKLDMFLKTAQLLQISGLTEKANDRVISEIEQRENAEKVDAQHLEEDTTTVASSSVGLIEESRRANKRTRTKETTENIREKSSRRLETQQIEDETILLTDVKCEPGEFIDFEDPLEDPLLQNENEHKEYGAIYPQTEDTQLLFVNMLEDFQILFDKRMTPVIKAAKDVAVRDLTQHFNSKTNQNLDAKQIQKKINNMKHKLKRSTCNERLRLNGWHKRFLDLWNSSENAMIQKVAGSEEMTSSKRRLSQEEVERKRCLGGCSE